jgi:hypothetical protein
LARSIREEGLLQPVGITEDGELVFGERRLLAVRDYLKRKTVLARVVRVSSIAAGEYAENEIRKDFTASERVAIARTLERQLGERRGNPSIRQKFDELTGRSDEAVAKRAGFGNRQTYRQAKKVVANGTAKLVLAMDQGRVSIVAASILADADAAEQEAILELDQKAILRAAEEIARRKADGFAGHERKGMTNDWLTPRYILDALGRFDLDPCAALGQPWATAKRHLTVKDDGLRRNWRGRVWLNPPYGDRTHLWLAKMAAHRDGIALLYARTETQMFHDHVWGVANGIFFFKGRVGFCRADGKPAAEVAGAPSVLVSYDAGASRRNYARLKGCGLEGQFLTIR